MGQLASALGVVPGTATTMVKTLAESGLVHYEPYMGVRLTAAGEKLASLVLRRHRLIELFLVKVLGMSWAEVHDEAERLEHAVSERLIDRIDEMLGRPASIRTAIRFPTAEGTMPRGGDDRRSADARRSRTPLVVTRVTRSGRGVPALRRAAPPDARAAVIVVDARGDAGASAARAPCESARSARGRRRRSSCGVAHRWCRRPTMTGLTDSPGNPLTQVALG